MQHDRTSRCETIPLIPRRVLFGNPDRTSPRISPDGTRLAFLAPVDGVLNIWVGPADDPKAASPVTEDRERGIRIYLWAYTSRHVLYLQDRAGDEDWHAYSVDLDAGKTIDLTPLEGVHAQIQGVSHRFPQEVVVGLNDRDPAYHDLYRVDILTAERMLIQRNDDFAELLIDDDYRVRLGARITPDGGSDLLMLDGDDSWQPFMKVEMGDLLTTLPFEFDKTGGTLYMIDSRGRDTSAMSAIELDTGEETLIAEDARVDVSDVMLHPADSEVQAVAFTYERKRWQVIDDRIAADFESLRSVADGDIEVVSRTLDDRTWIVAYLVDDGPVRYYRYDREVGGADFLFTNRSKLEGLPLASMRPVVIETRDGLEMVCYYTLPIRERQGPLPMVLNVHGGPWGRDDWGYDPIHQHLANRGYAVLSVNFRGSSGLGKGFMNAANLEWGGKMQDDLVDAVEWAVTEGIADADRVAVLGASYGGYAVLAGLTMTPDVFSCGVDLVGPSNLITMVETIPPYWKPAIEMEATRVGDSRTEEGRALLTERSPLTHVDRIVKPLLIGHGANDARVKRAESDQIVGAMKEKGIPVTYLVYPDEGHGFGRPENSISFTAVTEAFLAEYLGGRFEPVGDDFEGSSIQVEAGVEQVPSLEEAIRRRG